jgi:hypothetical protein
MKKLIVLLLAAPLMFALSACVPEAPAPTARDRQAQAAQQAANSISFTDNAEIDNVRRRLELTANPNLLGFIVLFNEAGAPIMYEGVRGKVTSGSKRLTQPDRVTGHSTGNGTQYVTRQAPSDEGTYGSSNPYIYYWNTNGEYRQWSGAYFYSTQPIRLRVEPVIVSVVPSAAQ